MGWHSLCDFGGLARQSLAKPPKSPNSCQPLIPDHGLSWILYISNYDSHHPAHCKNSIPFSQMLRLCRICSDEAYVCKQTKKLGEDFKECGYPKHIILKSIQRASTVSIEEGRKETIMELLLLFYLSIPTVLN